MTRQSLTYLLGGMKISVDAERAPELAAELARIAPDCYVPDHRTELARAEFCLALAQERIGDLARKAERHRRNATWWKLATWALLLVSFGLAVGMWGHRS